MGNAQRVACDTDQTRGTREFLPALQALRRCLVCLVEIHDDAKGSWILYPGEPVHRVTRDLANGEVDSGLIGARTIDANDACYQIA